VHHYRVILFVDLRSELFLQFHHSQFTLNQFFLRLFHCFEVIDLLNVKLQLFLMGVAQLLNLVLLFDHLVKERLVLGSQLHHLFGFLLKGFPRRLDLRLTQGFSWFFLGFSLGFFLFSLGLFFLILFFLILFSLVLLFLGLFFLSLLLLCLFLLDLLFLLLLIQLLN
jgi:hypothetical protein